MDNSDWIILNEILVGGTWTKMIANRSIATLQLVQDDNQLMITERKLSPPPSPLNTQLQTIKKQLSDENLDVKLFERAKLAIQPEHKKGDKMTIGRQQSHK